jgi:hypothetical protein
MPYLPVLTNLQVYAARGDAATDTLRKICPACALSGEPPAAEN